ncbi:hypothetical protein SDC9_46660 [bioreactor metagenome]|uniref:Phage protein n=1 Tax=bioreactor metagenome TaxID=1076179 RepID=A0A644W9G9_9ZZZZ
MKLTESEARSLATIYNMLNEIKTAGNDTILMAQCLTSMNNMLRAAVVEEPEKSNNEAQNHQENKS